MRRVSEKPDRCPICGDLTLHTVHGSFVYNTPDNCTPAIVVVDNVTWEQCTNCGEEFLTSEITDQLDKRVKRVESFQNKAKGDWKLD